MLKLAHQTGLTLEFGDLAKHAVGMHVNDLVFEMVLGEDFRRKHLFLTSVGNTYSTLSSRPLCLATDSSTAAQRLAGA